MSESTFPRRFGRYVLLDKVNAGGMAEVYRAKVTGVDNFQRIVAIKCMLPNLVEDQEFAIMFVDEARLAAQLNHGNIVQIYELGRHEEQLYIAMELVNGHDLRNTTKRARKLGKRLGVGFVAYIVSKAAEALDYAHNKLSLEGTPLNLVHRDVSPQNILVSYDGEVKVVDFGIAKAEHRATETRAGTLKGKFAYMAPEQVIGESIDRRADIFALGAVLYEAATGRPLFFGDTDLAILEKVRNAELPNLEEHLSHAPAQLCKVIRRACALEPENRYQSALDLAEDLAPVLISRGNLFGPKNARTTMRVLYEEEWKSVPRKLKEYAAIDIENEPERPSRTEIFGALLNTTGEVPTLAEQERLAAQGSESPTEGDSPSAPSAATEVFTQEELEARASNVGPAPGAAPDETGPIEPVDTALDPADPDESTTDEVPTENSAAKAVVRPRPEPSGRLRPEPSGRVRPEPSGRSRAPNRSALLSELKRAPPTVRYALIGLGVACLVTLVALIVVLAGRSEPAAAPVDPSRSEVRAPALETERAGDAEPDSEVEESATVVDDDATPSDPDPEFSDVDESAASAEQEPAAADREGEGETPNTAARPKRRFAWVSIDAKGVPATILLDGKEIGRAPIVKHRVRAGRHRVKFVPLDGTPARTIEVHVPPRYTDKNPMPLSLQLR